MESVPLSNKTVKSPSFREKLAVATNHAKWFFITFHEHISGAQLKKVTAILDSGVWCVFYIIECEEQCIKVRNIIDERVLKNDFDKNNLVIIEVTDENCENFDDFVKFLSAKLGFDIDAVKTRHKSYMAYQSGEIFSEFDFKKTKWIDGELYVIDDE